MGAGATTTHTTARFLAPDYLVQGLDNVLSCPLWASAGLVAPASGTCTVYDASNSVISTGAVTVTASIATYTVSAAEVPSTLQRGTGWRVEWSLVVGSTTLPTIRNSAALVLSILTPVVTDADLFRRVSALNPSANDPITVETDYQDKLDEAWTSILGRLVGAGNLPQLIMEPSAMREPHLLLTLALIFEDLGSRLNEAHAAQGAMYRTRYEAAWSDLRFEYDTSQTGRADGRRKRGASATVFLTARD